MNRDPLADFADRLKRACAASHGTAAPAFIEFLVHAYPHMDQLRAAVRADLDATAAALTPSGVSPEQRRTIKRFAIVQLAGRWAAEAGILPFTDAEIAGAVATVQRAWWGDQRSEGACDAERAVSNLAEFLIRHRSRFASPVAEPQQLPRDVAGYFADGRYWLTEKGLREAAGGYGEKALLTELKRRKLLHRDRDDRSKSRLTVHGERQHFYAIEARLLAEHGAEV